MLESEFTHRLDSRNSSSNENETTFINGPMRGLDPFGVIPEETMSLQGDLLDYASEFQVAFHGSNGLTTGPRGLECSGLDLTIEGHDLDGRPIATRVQVSYDQPDEDGIIFNKSQDEYCIYPNGVGISRRVTYKLRIGGTLDRQVLSERFIGRTDIPGLDILKKKILSKE